MADITADAGQVLPETDPVKELQEQMARVRQALGNVARSVDENPWMSTHDSVKQKINGDETTSDRLKEVLREFLEIIAILNLKMVGIFAALTEFGWRSDQAFKDMLAQEQELARSATGPAATEVLARLSDSLRDVLRMNYAEYVDTEHVGETLPTVVADLRAAMDALPAR